MTGQQTYPVTTAMILAAGLGTRMRPLTMNTPKPLINVRGRALMERVIDPLLSFGIKRFVVNVHWLASQVEDFCKDIAKDTGTEFIFSDERDQLLETGGGLAKARQFLGTDPVFVVNTDAFWGRGDIAPLKQLVEGYEPNAMPVRLLLADRECSLGYNGAGDFFMNDKGLLTRRGALHTAPYAFTGVRIIDPKIYDNTPIKPFSSNQLWNKYLANKQMHGVILDDFWLHVGDPIALADANAWLKYYP